MSNSLPQKEERPIRLPSKQTQVKVVLLLAEIARLVYGGAPASDYLFLLVLLIVEVLAARSKSRGLPLRDRKRVLRAIQATELPPETDKPASTSEYNVLPPRLDPPVPSTIT